MENVMGIKAGDLVKVVDCGGLPLEGKVLEVNWRSAVIDAGGTKNFVPCELIREVVR